MDLGAVRRNIYHGVARAGVATVIQAKGIGISPVPEGVKLAFLTRRITGGFFD
jgi:hypothetical protein